MNRSKKLRSARWQLPHAQTLHATPAQTSGSHGCGFSLVEVALSLGLLSLLLASLLPLQRAWENRQRDMANVVQMDQWMSQIEAFALTRRRLPCPAADIDGAEQAQSQTGPCSQSNGWLPWRSMGLARPTRSPLYAVATLESVGSPYALTLTRQDGFRSVPMDLLSSVIFGPPDTSGTSPGTLPALLIQAPASPSAPVSPTPLTGMPCSGNLFLTVSAVAVVSTDESGTTQFSGSNRCYQAPESGSRARMNWLSYERLMWLYVRAGLFSPP